MSLSDTILYVSSFEHALRSLVSSPLARLVNVPLGWAELYSKYCSLLVGLKNGLISSMWEDVYLCPL